MRAQTISLSGRRKKKLIMAVWLPRYRLNCQSCTEELKRYRGCNAPALQPFILEIDGKKEKLERCPLRLLKIWVMKAMEYYRFYKQGLLPSSGGIAQQSGVMLEAFDIIDNEMEKMRERDARTK